MMTGVILFEGSTQNQGLKNRNSTGSRN
uniref:Uncharacterized protein n=1 Tax=Arundo donax TaxID=35708 RepID=A0A0A9AI26_ARUDO